MRSYLLVFFVAAAVTYLMTPLMRHLAPYVHAYTPLRDRDVHTVPIARLGGLAMSLGVAASLVVASQIPFLKTVFGHTSQILGVALAAAWVVLLGAADDMWDLHWAAKLGGQIFAGVILAQSGVVLVSLPIAGLTIGSTQASFALTVVVVVAFINAVNFVDGLDGLAAGLVAIGGCAFFMYTYLLTTISTPENFSSLAAAILAVTVGICVGFLPHNFHPARIFMGDSGAMLLGLLMAAASVVVTGKIDPGRISAGQALPAFLPIIFPLLILGVPLLDMAQSVSRRLYRGQSPFAADRKHLHHRLLDRGLSHLGTVVTLYLWALVIAFSAAFMVLYPARVVLPVGAGALLLVMIATYVIYRVTRHPQEEKP